MKKIKTALCSFGMSGKVFHAPFLNVHNGFELYAVWERSKSVVKNFYADVKSYTTYEELLQDDAIDLVIVNTPNYTHYNYTKQALLAGKHVIVEKPFTVNVKEAEELITLANQVQKKISIYHNRRWDSDFKTVKKILKEGLLGEIVDAEIHFDRFKKGLSPKQHKETPGPGTGVLHDLGSHLIDTALQLLGRPIAVFSDLRILRPQSGIQDYMDILLYYNNLRVRLKSSYIVKEPLPAFILHGINGSFLKSRADVQETDLQGGKIPGNSWGIEPDEEKGLLHIEKEDGNSVREKIPTEAGNYMEYYDGIYEAIVNNKPMPVTGEEGVLVMKIIEATIESAEKKKIIELRSL